MPTFAFAEHASNQTPTLSGFISLWTLSLAPLLAHVVAGVPQTVYLAEPHPSVLELLVHWNPTSILWRYFAILDRRIRTKVWGKTALALANAVFWTESGWDGEDDIFERRSLRLTRTPRETHVKLLSASSLKTVVVALQGVQALYQFGPVYRSISTPFTILPLIFLPVAIFGLIRLPAAFWITDEFAFEDIRDERIQLEDDPVAKSEAQSQSKRKLAADDMFSNTIEMKSPNVATSGLKETAQVVTNGHDTFQEALCRMNSDSTALLQLQLPPHPKKDEPGPTLHPASSARGVLVRILFMLPIFGIAALALVYFSQIFAPGNIEPAVIFCMVITYVLFTLVTALHFLLNMIRGRSCTTVLPGISTTWYKLYTCILFLMAATTFIFACLAQIQPPCDSGDNCQHVSELSDFSLSFNGTSNKGPWNITGYINASYVFVSGRYIGFMEGINEYGSFNSTLGGELSIT